MFYEHCRINQQLYRDIVTLNWFLSATEAKATASKGKEATLPSSSQFRTMSYTIFWQYQFGNILLFFLLFLLFAVQSSHCPKNGGQGKVKVEVPKPSSKSKLKPKTKACKEMCDPIRRRCAAAFPLCHMTHWARVSSLHLDVDGARSMWPEFRYRYNSSSNSNSFGYF